MKEELKKVYHLHEQFSLPLRETPQTIPQKEFEFRYELIKEELNEYREACRQNNTVEIADALGDLLYAIYGTIIQHGIQDKMKEIFEEIDASNMSKLDENGKPIIREDGKIIKSNQFFKPDIKTILEKN